jgi:hypothetical protein
MNNNTLIGMGIAAGALILGGGAAFMVAKHYKNKKELPVPFVQQIGVPVQYGGGFGRIVGRPFSDPFYTNYGNSSVWGSGPWAHRSPRTRSPIPNFGPRRH